MKCMPNLFWYNKSTFHVTFYAKNIPFTAYASHTSNFLELPTFYSSTLDGTLEHLQAY